MLTYGVASIAIIPAPALAQEEDTEIWIGATASGTISGSLLGSIETTLRIDDQNTREATRVLRPMLGYQVSKPISLWIGYTRVDQFPSGHLQTTENRAFQQLNWNMGKLGAVSLSSRTRLEQRFFANDGGSAWRMREQLKATVPLPGSKVSIVATTEPFFTLQSSIPGAHSGLEQWRSSIGVSVPLTHRVTLEGGYMNRYIIRRSAPD